MIRHEAYSWLEVVDKEPNREVIMLSDLQFRVFGPYGIPDVLVKLSEQDNSRDVAKP